MKIDMTTAQLERWRDADARMRLYSANYEAARAERGAFLEIFIEWLESLGYRRRQRSRCWSTPRRHAALLRILERDGFGCAWCGFDPGPGRLELLALHHMIPRSWGGPNEDWNLVALCDLCHGREKPMSANSAWRLFVVLSGTHGAI